MGLGWITAGGWNIESWDICNVRMMYSWLWTCACMIRLSSLKPQHQRFSIIRSNSLCWLLNRPDYAMQLGILSVTRKANRVLTS